MASSGAAGPAAAPAWWRLEMAAPAELEESLLWKLQSLGILRVAVRHRPETPADRQLLAWLPAIDWPEPQRRSRPGGRCGRVVGVIGAHEGSCSLDPVRARSAVAVGEA